MDGGGAGRHRRRGAGRRSHGTCRCVEKGQRVGRRGRAREGRAGLGWGAPEAPARPARRTARHLPTSAATVGCGGRDEAACKGGRGGGGGRVLAGTHLACDRAPRHGRFRSFTAEAASAASTAAHATRQPRAASPQQLLRPEGLSSATPPVAERSSWRRRGRAGTACAPDAGAGGSPGRRQRRPTGVESGTSTSMKVDRTASLIKPTFN